MLNFDPLNSNQGFDEEVMISAKKREIRNILKSYVGNYDAFSELIQNSMDSVDRRSREEEGEYQKKIWITINLKENSFTITDNGVGFNEKEFKAFLAPNISFKDGINTRGNKGVGSTYIAYGFNSLKLGTKNGEFNYFGELKSGRSWAEDDKGLVTRPEVVRVNEYSTEFDNIDRGATFTLTFIGENIRPKDLSWYTATTPEQWLYLLLVKTPLGSIDFFSENSKEIRFSLKVIDKNNIVNELDNVKSEYKLPHNEIKSSIDLKEIKQLQKKLVDSGKDVSSIPPKYYKLNGIYEYFSNEELKRINSTKIKEEEVELIKKYEISAYGYFSFSTSVWDELNDRKANLRKGHRIIKGGIQMANNYMPQGELLTIPLTSNIGYQNQTHIIIHFKNADPDLGRKGFQPELKELSENLGVAIVNNLKKWKHHLRIDTGTKPSIEKDMELHTWIKEQEKYEEINPLELKNKNFFKPVNEISITSKPQSEQDVIVLFNQLIAGGVIRGIKLLATSQIKQYDGLFKFYLKEPINNHKYNKDSNPLGVEEIFSSKEMFSKPMVLEYKYNVDALIAEFENEEKKEKDIDLIIAWEMGESWHKNYEITSLLDLSNLQHREFHGITHIIQNSTAKTYAIILKELIEYLNDIDGVQDYQMKTYGIELF